MDEILWAGAGLLVGMLLGGAVIAVVMMRRHGAGMNDLAEARSRASMLDEQAQRLSGEISAERETRAEADRRLAAAEEQLRARQTQIEEQKKFVDEANLRLREAFGDLSSKALQSNTQQFLNFARQSFEKLLAEAKGDGEKRHQAIDAVVKPIRELLEKHNVAVKEIETKREGAYKALEQQIKHISESHQRLGEETGKLVTALRRPEQRGRWGEVQLRNVVELAGMSAHCDFCEQVQTDHAATRDRPDMTVRIPGGGVIVVDSKVALDAYLDAIEAETQDRRDHCLMRHASQVETHFKKLAAKEYWKQFDKTPQLVVMFVSMESALMAALERKPDLHAQAMQEHVLIATPTLLVATLRAIAYGWQQEAIAENARQIGDTGRELYDRLSVFVSHFEKVGGQLGKATDSYNKAVGSLERSVLPSTRRLRELGASAKEETAAPPQIEVEVREVMAAELKQIADGVEQAADETIVTKGQSSIQ